MLRYVLTVAAVAASLTPAASALVECREGDVQCYRTCYLPQVDKEHGVYWYTC